MAPSKGEGTRGVPQERARKRLDGREIGRSRHALRAQTRIAVGGWARVRAAVQSRGRARALAAAHRATERQTSIGPAR